MHLVSWTLLLALVLCVAILVAGWAYLRTGRSAGRARRLDDGTQEARIVVDHGYTPSRIALDAGTPTTLRFERREDVRCTELLISELWPSAHRLIAHGETAIRFTPQRPGRFAFTCGMGMYSGELVVNERRDSLPSLTRRS